MAGHRQSTGITFRAVVGFGQHRSKQAPTAGGSDRRGGSLTGYQQDLEHRSKQAPAAGGSDRRGGSLTGYQQREATSYIPVPGRLQIIIMYRLHLALAISSSLVSLPAGRRQQAGRRYRIMMGLANV
eukprot:scaffold120478_cov60-Attheya_sp.AAC.1